LRALVAFLFAVGPNLPGVALSITPTIQISDGAANLYTFDWLYGFVVSIFLYSTLSYFFSAKETLVETTIYGRDDSSQLSDKEHQSAPNYEKDFGNVDAVKVAQNVNYPQEKI
jgi:hypothetical protein